VEDRLSVTPDVLSLPRNLVRVKKNALESFVGKGKACNLRYL
jgi:hypothetical protein